ncbi:MAG: hypothetical protein K6T73_06070 [Candidatus Bathyarchaeota archaeon]|nr:hypothetical protein [Candidatus Bathyarchaeota archaeon]
MSSVLSGSAPKIFALVGLTLTFLGIALLKPLGFSPETPIFMSLGTVFLIISVLLHFEISQKSSFQEKAFATILCASLLLVAMAVIIYTVVKVDYYWIEASQGGYAYYRSNDLASMFLDPRAVAPKAGVTPNANPHYKIHLIVNHVYSDYAVLFCEVGIALFFLSVYIKLKFL